MESFTKPVVPKVDQRLDQARNWLDKLGVDIQSEFQSIAGDASFRRYFRLTAHGVSRILMDAPPPREDTRPFIDICRRLRSADLHAPKIIHANPVKGYLLLEDLGDELLRNVLHVSNAQEHFPVLLDTLGKVALTVDASGLPIFDGQLLRGEMDLFRDWYIGCHRDTAREIFPDTIWDGFCTKVIASALDQTRCFVHRDFHSCNLIRTNTNTIGIIDFQDAVLGPVSYDFVSLIWDRYIHWPRTAIETWMEEYRQILGLCIDPKQWRRDCDLMGLQRNVKIVGIFARLYYRDHKEGYLELIPHFYKYITSTLHRYPEFFEVLDILESTECAP